MFQIGEEDFSFGDEDFWSEALEVEAATGESDCGKSAASSGKARRSHAAEKYLQQSHTGSCPTEKVPLARCEVLSTQMPGQHLGGLRNARIGLEGARALQVSDKDLPTTPEYPSKRKFSFKQKSPGGNATALVTSGSLGTSKRAKYDEQPTPFTNTNASSDNSSRLQDPSSTVQMQPNLTTGNLREPTNHVSAVPKLIRQALNKDQQCSNQGISQQFLSQKNETLLDETSECRTKYASVTGGDPTLPERANQDFRLQGQKAKTQQPTENLFEFGDYFDEEMSEEYFNWDPVIEPSSTANPTPREPQPVFMAGNQSKQPNHEKRLSGSGQYISDISKPSSVPSVGSTPGYSPPNLNTQSRVSNLQTNPNQLRPISTQGVSLRFQGQQNNSSSGGPQSTTRFNAPLTTPRPRPNFPQPQTQQLQGNPPRMNFQPRTQSPSFPPPRPGTQYPLRTNTPTRAVTPGYTSPSPRLQGVRATRGVTLSPQTANMRMSNTNSSTPRQFAMPAQRFQNSTQGDRPFSTHGAKPQSRGTPTPPTPLLTSRVAQLFQTPPTSSSGPSSTRVRKFPGPAGVLPKLAQGQKLNDIQLPSPETNPDEPCTSSSKQEELGSSQDVGESDFSHGAWQTMKTDLGLVEGDPHSILARNNIALVLRKASLKQLTKNKVPHLCVMVKAVALDADTSVVLRDPTGEMQGTVHRRVVEEHQSDLKPGTVLVLRQVGVLSPSLRNHYLNITPSNVIQIYPSEAAGLSQCSQRTPTSRPLRHPPTSREGSPAETELSTPTRSRASVTQNRHHSGGVQGSTFEEASLDNTACSLRRSASGSRLVEEGKPVNHQASDSSDLRPEGETRIAKGHHGISSRLEGETTQSSVSCGNNGPNAHVPKLTTTVAESSSNAQKSEDFTELLADIGDDFFDDF